jgi:group I intron endonuclease
VVINQINNKLYVGKTNNPTVRWHDHKKVALGGREKYPEDFFAIHAALHKYGIYNFIFKIIDEFDDENEAYRAETQYILLSCSNLKKFGYNCNLGGEGGISPSPETRQKLIAAANKPEKIKLSSDMMKKRHQDNPGFLSNVHKGNQYTKGRKLPQKEKDHLSKMMKGRFVSDETKKKMSEAQTGEKSSRAKLTEKEVLEIRSKYIPGKYGYVKLSKEYGVHDETIRSIIKRTSWSHI